MKKFLKDLKNLISGMGITGKHLGRHAITIQYPEQKMEMFERSRGVVVLLSDKETGELNCTSCMLCMKACPTAAIYIDSPRGEDKKRRLKQFDIDFSLCCYCGLCEESCNFDAIKLANKYEFSNFSIEENTWDMHKLQEVGRDVPYEVTRKKKKPVAKKKAAKPAQKSDEKSQESSKEATGTAPKPPKKDDGTPESKPAVEPKDQDQALTVNPNPETPETDQKDAKAAEPRSSGTSEDSEKKSKPGTDQTQSSDEKKEGGK